MDNNNNNIKPLEKNNSTNIPDLRKPTAKMDVWDWQAKIPQPNTANPDKIIEVRFKNTRKGYYINTTGLQLKQGDIIAVEGNPGVDIGVVTITSPIVKPQMKRTCPKMQKEEMKKVLRMATTTDVEKWAQAISREHSTMIESRRISADLGLDMKIGDVEFQGDGMKAIFYYIAEGRVDFRELIKVLFERFRIRVEMKQIGARQEAGRIGGIGPCGRELCCSSWVNHFSTIGIGAARAQDISFNPQKLAGQCSKLKCCLNYEVDTYLDAKKALPRVNAPLEAMDGSYYLIKIDILTGTMYFSPAQNNYSIQIPLSSQRVREIQSLNAQGQKVDSIEDKKFLARTAAATASAEPELKNIELEESLTRFDKNKRHAGGGGGGGNRNNNRNRNKNRGNRSGGIGNSGGGGNNVGGGSGEQRNHGKSRNHKPRKPQE